MNADGGANIKPKRGRRTKKEIEAAKAEAQAHSSTIDKQIIVEMVENAIVENAIVENAIEIKIDCTVADEKINLDDNDENIVNMNTQEGNIIVKQSIKKRGRKPKGGKIVQQTAPILPQQESKPNIILHLKCSLKDLNSSGDHNSNFTTTSVDPYNFESKNEFTYELLNDNNFNLSNNDSNSNFMNNNNGNNSNNNNNNNGIENKKYTIKDTNESDDFISNTNETREIWRKLKILEKDLHINNISDKKSACFWCSHDFDSPPIYIPKHFIKDSYHVYGCFCTPECAVAHLMEENIDSSTKFERYHLINHIYSKIYEYKKNIKPAPDPHYMLDKYYGNLSIQEYRALLRSDRLFLIVDKPLTRILPEFHEDNDDFIINNKIIPSNNYQVKKQIQKKTPQTKNNILNEKFGIQNVIAPVH
jgi:hypothetical protein